MGEYLCFLLHLSNGLMLCEAHSETIIRVTYIHMDRGRHARRPASGSIKYTEQIWLSILRMPLLTRKCFLTVHKHCLPGKPIHNCFLHQKSLCPLTRHQLNQHCSDWQEYQLSNLFPVVKLAAPGFVQLGSCLGSRYTRLVRLTEAQT